MKSLWDDQAAPSGRDDLALRAYSSCLIGLDRALVLHGGGNTSVKTRWEDRFGDTHEVLFVKASGFDLAKMGPEGFTGLLMDPVMRLAGLKALSDAEMVSELLRARIDPLAAAPSIEAMVHGIVPKRFVDHSHADAVLTISNSPRGTEILGEIYGSRVKVLPYVKPGFDLARQFDDFFDAGGFEDCDAIILEHHGVFTFADDARVSYEAMIATVQVAEDYLAKNTRPVAEPAALITPIEVALARKEASKRAGRALFSLPAGGVAIDQVADLFALAHNGTVTPEHVIHNKPFPALIMRADPADGFERFSEAYRAYFQRAGDPSLVMLPDYPHWAFFDDGSVRSFGPNAKRAGISADVAGVTHSVLGAAHQLGGWQGLSEADLRAIEYWELEQAKLKRHPPDPVLSGKVAVVAGSATGIGRAIADLFTANGAIVAGLDIDPSVTDAAKVPGQPFGYQVDLRNEEKVQSILDDVVQRFGGIDILVCNAGIFRSGSPIETLSEEDWDLTLSVNLSAHRKVLKCAIPYLKHGVDPSVVFIASRNVPAPGAGAAAYSVSKAGLTQLMRVAALELAEFGVRVNAVHPDAVFDTNLWTEDALKASAKRYGMSVEAYKQRNLLKAEIRSSDVAAAVLAFVDGTLRCTTGAQLPVDGGNERVI